MAIYTLNKLLSDLDMQDPVDTMYQVQTKALIFRGQLR